jgi:hypothetical protein
MQITMKFARLMRVQIGSGWSPVVEKICGGKYQPLLLAYVSSGHSRPINLETAPIQTFFTSNFHFRKTLQGGW